MAEQSSVQGSVTLRKLRTGATATISLSSTKQLFQLYSESTSGTITYAPNWSILANAPVITVNAVSSQGSVTVANVLWKINNTQADTIEGVTAASTGGVHTLTINTNLAKILGYTSGTLTAEITITDASGATQTVTKTEVIRIQKAVANGYNVMINCNKAYVDGSTDSSNPTTLSAVIYNGVYEITNPSAENISFYWYDSASLNTANLLGEGSSYNITDPGMVNGSQLFMCVATDNNGDELDAESIIIVDNSDPLFIAASAQQSKGASTVGIPAQDNVTSVNVAADNDSTKVTFKVVDKNGGDWQRQVSAWTAEKRHADTMKLIGKVDGESYTTDTTAADGYNTATASNAATVSITVYDADYKSDSGGTSHDTEVIATATAQL